MNKNLSVNYDQSENIEGHKNTDALNYGSMNNLLDLKALMFLALDNNINSVKNLIYNKYPYKSPDEKDAVTIIYKLNMAKSDSDIIDQYRKECENTIPYNKIDYYSLLFESVFKDFRECVPNYSQELMESDLIKTNYHECTCDFCGESILMGEEIYIRTKPSSVKRHKKCNNKVRFNHEYAYINNILKNIESFEKIFRNNENSDYILDDSFSYKPFKKSGYIIDNNGLIVRLPNFSKFVEDYTSGDDDYTLIKKYRPYHIYLEYLLKLKGLSNNDLKRIGGGKYLLREEKGKKEFSDLSLMVERTSYSEIFWDEPIYNLINTDIKNLIYSEAIKNIFQSMGIYHSENYVKLNGNLITYSINDINYDADLLITIDHEGIMCTDSKSSKYFNEYFKSDVNITNIVEYIMNMEANF